MKSSLLFLLSAGILLSQTLPTLPAVSTITIGTTTCTLTVVDSLMSVSGQCLSADGTILGQEVKAPHVKGAPLGLGPVFCLLWTDGAPSPTVRLQCASDDDVTPPKLAIDGKLAPPAAGKKRQWWIFWR